ncbi:valine--tRNA ligase [Methanobrevibacter sp. DSM 116169]|uniref:valine--tRNA ligase n=1 Tax=Methanobrevibacter sp. DSM 116169 TaxID=3242727 RepID=UPI0038FD275B
MLEKDIPKDYNQGCEKEWQKKWENDEIYKFLDDGTKPRYVIDTPPPYPTGSIHLGHVLNWTYIDMNARYRRLKGLDVLFPQGWDCHGLPTEVKVEETHNIKKNDISKAEFRKYCVDLTTENIDLMKNQMKLLGFSQDWSREFVTMTPEYMRKTQYSFLKMYDDNLLYQGIHPVNWCPRCETAIAFAEVEYDENETFLNYVNFPPAKESIYDDITSSKTSGKQAQADEEGVLIATTRPELMSACVAVVVNPEDSRYSKLLNKYVEVPLSCQKVKIIADEEVDPEFGTGAVMVCTFGDKTDVSWVNKHGLEIIEAIDEKGLMTESAGRYEGLGLQECKLKTIDDLEDEGYLIKQENVDQNVGKCWRCKTPIEILVKKQWFIAVRDLTSQIKDAANDMNWVPEHMKSRLLNWADSMEWDWCISRQRIFATPIPVWYCKDCGEIILPAEEDLPIDPISDKPQKPCKCGSTEFTGEEDVLDTWMDSSISPLSIAGWPNKEFKNNFPSNIRPQGHDIIRTWAFYTILRTLALEGEKPFDDIVINGMVFGEDGYKMSKSRGNVVGPEEVVSEYGADALRTWAANSLPGSDVAFDWKDIKYGYKFLRKFWNAFRFISMHIFNEEIKYEEIANSLNPSDKWILSKLNNLNKDVDEAFNTYTFANTINAIEKFVWHDFCDEYIEAVKYRLYNDDISDESRKAAKYTLKTVIETSLILLSPITPFFSEEVYQYFNEDISVHNASWPQINNDLISEDSENEGKIAIDIIGDIRRFKSSSKIPLNVPLDTVKIYADDEIKNTLDKFSDDIKGTLKINNLILTDGKPDVHEKIVEITPDMSKIGPEFKNDAGKIIKYLNTTSLDEIANILDENNELAIDDLKITEDYLNIEKELVEASGKKVDIINSQDLDAILEIIK